MAPCSLVPARRMNEYGRFGKLIHVLIVLSGSASIGQLGGSTFTAPDFASGEVLGSEHPVGIMVFGAEYQETVCVTVTA